MTLAVLMPECICWLFNFNTENLKRIYFRNDKAEGLGQRVQCDGLEIRVRDLKTHSKISYSGNLVKSLPVTGERQIAIKKEEKKNRIRPLEEA